MYVRYIFVDRRVTAMLAQIRRQALPGGMIAMIERIGGVKSGTGGQALPFCQATKAGGFVFVSGQVAMNPEGEIVDGGIVTQTHQTMRNVIAILEKAGCTLDDVVNSECWLSDPREFVPFNAIYKTYFTKDPPVRSVFPSQFMFGCKVEMKVVAYKPLTK